jgi:hypothetical protein
MLMTNEGTDGGAMGRMMVGHHEVMGLQLLEQALS